MVVAGILTNHRIQVQLFIVFFGLLLFCIYLYKIQYGINEKEYLKEMIEHHSMALLTSKNILKKTDNPLVSNFAAKIFNTQMKEIEEMEGIIKRI